MRNYTLYILLCTLSFSLLLCACEESVNLPKKHGYPRMDLPDKTIHATYQSKSCPFIFEAPKGGEIVRDLTDSCWLDLFFPKYNLTWHISHRDTRSNNQSTDIHFEQHRKLVYKHSQKATEIRPSEFRVSGGYVIAHELFGEVGSPYYVFMRDSSNTQVAMMSLYFQTSLENDSLAPVIAYMKKEMDRTVGTLRWK